MSSFIINPGSGPVENACVEDAIKNIKQFIKDCEIELKWKRDLTWDDEGRFSFIIYKRRKWYFFKKDWHRIDMPGLPMDEVHYMGAEGQNIWDFPRLYYDGSSWIWMYAIDLVREDFNKPEEEADGQGEGV